MQSPSRESTSDSAVFRKCFAITYIVSTSERSQATLHTNIGWSFHQVRLLVGAKQSVLFDDDSFAHMNPFYSIHNCNPGTTQETPGHCRGEPVFPFI